MPKAARKTDPTSHGNPLNPGPGSLDVTIGFVPAWRALPSSVGSALESLSNTMNSFITAPVMTPADATPKIAQASKGMTQLGAKCAAAGAPGVASTAATQLGTVNATNTTLTATWTSASAAPGGQPAANQAYTEGIKAAMAVAASATVAAMAGMADMHICPMPAGTVLHGPGFVTKGSSSVMINNLPASRQNDKVMEACGGADPISMGCPTVDIGDSGGGGGGGGGDGGGGGGGAGGGGSDSGLWGGEQALLEEPEDDELPELVPLDADSPLLEPPPEYTPAPFDGRCRDRPLRQQERPMSCGPAALSMMIESVTGRRYSEQLLRDWSSFRGRRGSYDPVRGTGPTEMRRMLDDFDVETHRWDRSPTIDEIEEATQGGRPALLRLRNPGHYVLVDGVESGPGGSRRLLIRDPGPAGRAGCREIEVGGDEWNERIVTEGARLLRVR
jgi:hypothetical protein